MSDLDRLSEKIEKIGQCTESLRQLKVAIFKPGSDLHQLQVQIASEEKRAKSVIGDATIALRERCNRGGDAETKRRLEKLMKDFKRIFKQHEDMMKTVIDALREEIDKRGVSKGLASAPVNARGSLNNNNSSGNNSNYNPYDEEEAGYGVSMRQSGGQGGGGGGGGGARSGELHEPLIQKLDAKVTSWDQAMQEEQLADLQLLEKDLESLATLYQDVALMVQEQQTTIDNIEVDIGETNARVEAGLVHLKKAKESQKSARKKMLCILCCLVIIAAVVVGILGGFSHGFTSF